MKTLLSIACYILGIWVWVQLGGVFGFVVGIGGAYWLSSWVEGSCDNVQNSGEIGGADGSPLTPEVQHLIDAKSAEYAQYQGSHGILIAMLAKLAKLDGTISRNEISLVESVFVDLGLIGESRDTAISVFNLAKSGPLTFQETVMIAKMAIAGQQQETAPFFLMYLFMLAGADGNISAHARETLKEACELLEVPWEVMIEGYYATKNREAAACSPETSDAENAYATLGCSKSDSDATIKSKYRELVKTFHPDTIASKSLHPEFIKFASDRFDTIKAAFDTIMRSRGLTPDS